MAAMHLHEVEHCIASSFRLCSEVANLRELLCPLVLVDEVCVVGEAGNVPLDLVAVRLELLLDGL